MTVWRTNINNYINWYDMIENQNWGILLFFYYYFLIHFGTILTSGTFSKLLVQKSKLIKLVTQFSKPDIMLSLQLNTFSVHINHCFKTLIVKCNEKI